MKRNEEEARKLCAYCNWITGCIACSYRVWPNKDKLVDMPLFDYTKCEYWRYYIDYPVSRLHRFLCWIGLHDYYFRKDLDKEICIRCLHENRVSDISIRMMMIDPIYMR